MGITAKEKVTDELAIQRIKEILGKNPQATQYTLKVKVGIGDKRLAELCEKHGIKLPAKVSKTESGKRARMRGLHVNDHIFGKYKHG